MLLLGCSSHANAVVSPRMPEATEVSTKVASPAPNPGAGEVGSEAQPAPTVSVLQEGPPPQPPVDPMTGEKPRSLPELKLKLVGLHIGGGPNDAETKRPFIDALELGFDAMRACYVHASDPQKGGTFGVDLRVERQGGHPQLQAVRTAMRGEEFKSCLEQAFGQLDFDRPAKGPTVLSASVRFSLES